jgi:hypothetical protein
MLLDPRSCGGLCAAAFVIGTSLCGTALAADGDRPTWAVSGFGTLGFVHSNGREADYAGSAVKPTGAGWSRAWSPNVDSRLGAQLDLQLDRRWSAVLQAVSEQNLDHGYRPRIDWANVKYQLTPDLALRAGRIALPVFLAADYRKVGYAYAWVRPPVEVYGAQPLDSSDGADLTWRFGAAPVRNTTQAFFGRKSMGLTPTTRLEMRHMTGISQTAEYGPLTARLSALTADVALLGSEDGMDSRGPVTAIYCAPAQQQDRQRVSIASLGLAYDPGSWFVMGEASHIPTASFLGKTTAMYASAGVRRGAFTPYAGFARVRAASTGTDPDPGLITVGLAPPARIGANLIGGVAPGTNPLLHGVPSQSSVSAGVRWDLRRNVALKAQLDRVLPHEGSHGTLVNIQPGFEPGHALQVASATLDFVF